MRRTLKKTVAVGLAAATAFSLCACGGSGDGSKSGSKDSLEVVIWDNNQQKGLQQICDLFTEETGIKLMYRLRSGIHTGHFLRLEHQVEICRMYSGCTPTTHRCT